MSRPELAGLALFILIFMTISTTPAAIAGVTPSVLWTRQKLHQTE